MKHILLFFMLLIICGEGISQSGIIIEEKLEKYTDLNEENISALIEDMEDSLFIADMGSDSTILNSRYRNNIRINTITSFWGFMEQSEGFSEEGSSSAFLGPSFGLRTRLRVRGRNFTIKGITESDPGESGFRNPDHRSIGIEVSPKGEPFKIVFGDYHFEAGLGMALATRPGFSSWKAEPHLLIRKKSRMSVHGGGDENRYFCGGAIDYSYGKFSSKIFISGRNLDAGLKEDIKGEPYFTSLSLSGLHRNEKELDKKDKVYEEAAGLIIGYSSNRFEVGLLAAGTSYSERFQLPENNNRPFAEREYQNSFSKYSAWGRRILGDGMLLGELAFSDTGGSALIIAYSGFIAGGLGYIISYRSVSNSYPTYNTLISSSFIKKGLSREGRINFLWQSGRRLGLQGDMVVKGMEPVQGGSTPGYRIKARIFSENLMVSSDCEFRYEPDKVMGVFRVKSGDSDYPFKWQAELGLSSNRIRGLLDCPGSYFSMRGKYKNSKGTILIQSGLGFFTARDGSGIFYIYEPDVRYGMSLPALSGTGYRVFLLIQYQVIKNLKLEFKISRHEYDDRKVIGSGLDRIPGNHKTGVKIQVIYH